MGFRRKAATGTSRNIEQLFSSISKDCIPGKVDLRSGS